MPREGRTPFRNKERDRRYKEIIERAAQKEFGLMHELPFPFSENIVREHEKLLWHEARYQGYGRKVHVTRLDDGNYKISFQLWDKATARQFVADRARKTGELPYNTRRPRKET
jgi:hypothetical protein